MRVREQSVSKPAERKAPKRYSQVVEEKLTPTIIFRQTSFSTQLRQNMNNDKLWLKSEIEKFLSVINDCIENTTYKEDINIYKRDFLFVKKWLEELEKDNVSHLDIVNEILDIQTAKILNDYWRNGECGDKHNKAFINLISKVNA